MDVQHDDFRNVEIRYRAEDFENWDEDVRSSLVIVLKKFWCQSKQWEDNFVAKVVKGKFVVYFLHYRRNYRLQSLDGTEQFCKVATILKVVSDIGNDLVPIVRVLVFCQDVDDLSVSRGDRSLLAILNER